MKKIEAIIRTEKLDEVKNALAQAGFIGLNTVAIIGRGRQRGIAYTGRGETSYPVDMLPKTKLEVVAQDSAVERLVQTIIQGARTGNVGDGKIFITPVEEVIRVRTGERGKDVL
jgi:nitrogen regulatory protein P-II 1